MISSRVSFRQLRTKKVKTVMKKRKMRRHKERKGKSLSSGRKREKLRQRRLSPSIF